MGKKKLLTLVEAVRRLTREALGDPRPAAASPVSALALKRALEVLDASA